MNRKQTGKTASGSGLKRIPEHLQFLAGFKPKRMELTIIKQKIHTIRGLQVMLDFDLAELYEVPTKALKQAVRRNLERFPEDFMFELTLEEYRLLRSQSVTLDQGRGKHAKYLPFAFNEYGIAMLSSVLNSDRAIQINIAIIRAFISLREYAMTHTEIKKQIADLEARFQREFADVHEALRWLATENQARADDIADLQDTDEPEADWENRERIGFKKDT